MLLLDAWVKPFNIFETQIIQQQPTISKMPMEIPYHRSLDDNRGAARRRSVRRREAITSPTQDRNRSDDPRRNHTRPSRDYRSESFHDFRGRSPESSEEEFSHVDFYSDLNSDDTDEDDESEFTFDAPHLDTFELPTAHAVLSSNGLAEPVSKADSSILKQKSLEVAQIVSSKYIERRENGSVEFSGELMRVSGRVPSLFSWL
jgi:hypothetical protein